MKSISKSLLVAPALLALAAASAQALTTSTTSITCSSTARLQAKIDAVPAGTVATINVSGTCRENIVIPAGKTVIIKGATSSALITPANVLLPALISRGDTTVQRMIIRNATGSAETLVQSDKGGSLNIHASDLSAPNVGTVVAAWIGSVRIVNSRVIGGTDDAAEVSGASNLVIKGDPSIPTGPTGLFESYLKSPGSAVLCGHGGMVKLTVGRFNSASGIVTVEKSGTGLHADTCAFTVSNGTGSKANVRIRSNGTGVRLNNSQGTIQQATISASTGDGVIADRTDFNITQSTLSANNIGLTVNQSRVAIDGTMFNNVKGDVDADLMSSVQFSNSLQSSLPKALTWTKSFACAKGSRIDLDAGALTAPLGSQYDFLGCLYQH